MIARGEDVDDHRAKPIQITAKGRELASRVERVSQALERELLGGDRARRSGDSPRGAGASVEPSRSAGRAGGQAMNFAARQHAKPSPLWLLALITLSGTLAMHIFVPALPAAARGPRATAGAAEMTLSVYVIGLVAGTVDLRPDLRPFRPAARADIRHDRSTPLASLAALAAPTHRLADRRAAVPGARRMLRPRARPRHREGRRGGGDGRAAAVADEPDDHGAARPVAADRRLRLSTPRAGGRSLSWSACLDLQVSR